MTQMQIRRRMAWAIVVAVLMAWALTVAKAEEECYYGDENCEFPVMRPECAATEPYSWWWYFWGCNLGNEDTVQTVEIVTLEDGTNVMVVTQSPKQDK